MEISLLVDRIPWFGAHSGYEQLARHLQATDQSVSITHSQTSRRQIRLGKMYALARGWWARRDFVYAAAELRFALAARGGRAAIRHLLYGEVHHHFLERWRKAPAGVIASIHHPPAQWRQWPERLVRNLARLSSAIVLYRADLERFEALVGRGRVRFIPHGVDTDFFRPDGGSAAAPPRILFAGQNGRNTRMVQRVVGALAARHPQLRFDFLVRRHIRELDGLRQLVGHPQIDWHEGVGDDALRDLYRGSRVLLLPFECCGASNALVEALACGVPVVTTDVGGVRDYGAGALYPVVGNDDDAAMVGLVESYLAAPAWRDEVGRRCRAFAEQELAWPRVAQLHLDAYRELAAR